jgi:hypothetical protein
LRVCAAAAVHFFWATVEVKTIVIGRGVSIASKRIVIAPAYALYLIVRQLPNFFYVISFDFTLRV